MTQCVFPAQTTLRQGRFRARNDPAQSLRFQRKVVLKVVCVERLATEKIQHSEAPRQRADWNGGLTYLELHLLLLRLRWISKNFTPRPVNQGWRRFWQAALSEGGCAQCQSTICRSHGLSSPSQAQLMCACKKVDVLVCSELLVPPSQYRAAIKHHGNGKFFELAMQEVIAFSQHCP